ncbi:M14 family metallocarboxypeptidase [Actinophytocola sp.]|uniref:M14 family metallopeptidase n=1 Tax=Actinophytocola sp. TaxID=1872138 RepID=UPI002D7E4929|nr:M14 family metallocarboxypeptidase [Actinophytocola sp.]HET9143215.1 M14 family metallocarboxypeptidase [Actinophytocola sp.]
MLRVRTLLTSAAVVAGLVAVPAALGPAGAAAEAVPRTGFEESGGARWTTIEEEHAFLAAVDRSSRRMSMTQVGTTLQGRPLHLVRLGDPAPARHSMVALFLCSQHGDEPAGREACLIRIRDFAFSDDAAVRRLLRTTTLLFVPTANPDGRVANTRGNAEGVDINRDHIALATPEGRAIATVFRDFRPDVVHDLHEFGPTPPFYDKDLLWLWPRNLNVDPRVHDESESLSRDFVRVAVESEGHTSGVYGIWVDPVTGEPIRQVAGDGQERILRNTSGLKHALGLLVESNVDPNPGEDAVAAANRRVRTHLLGVQGTLRMVTERRAQVELATTLSRLTAPFNRGPIYFGGADNQPPDPARVEPNPPCGYRLTAEQFTQVRETLALHDVRSVRTVDGGRLVPMFQPARPLIPLLLDPRADFEIVAGVASPNCR